METLRIPTLNGMKYSHAQHAKNYFTLQLLLFLASVASCPAADDLSPGKPFPPISLPSINGSGKVDLREQLGDKLMLHLFASW